MERLVIAGGPKTGKTTKAEAIGRNVRHTDDLIGMMGWSESSAEVSTWLDEPGPWVVEGVATVRALRKWLARNPTGAPADRVLFLTEPRAATTPQQRTMAKGVETVWREVEPQLRERGVAIDYA